MKLIINHSSMQPIYEQIVEQTKKIMHTECGRDDAPISSYLLKILGQCTDLQKAYDALSRKDLSIRYIAREFHVCQSEQCLGRRRRKWPVGKRPSEKADGMGNQEITGV